MNNYKLTIDWSPKDNAFIATCPEFEGLAIVADTREQALKDAEEALQAYIEIYQADGRPLPVPETVQEYSGQIRLRLPRSLHQKASRLAEREDVSLNTFLISAISAEVGVKDSYIHIVERLESRYIQLMTAQTTNAARLFEEELFNHLNGKFVVEINRAETSNAASNLSN